MATFIERFMGCITLEKRVPEYQQRVSDLQGYGFKILYAEAVYAGRSTNATPGTTLIEGEVTSTFPVIQDSQKPDFHLAIDENGIPFGRIIRDVFYPLNSPSYQLCTDEIEHYSKLIENPWQRIRYELLHHKERLMHEATFRGLGDEARLSVVFGDIGMELDMLKADLAKLRTTFTNRRGQDFSE